MYVASDLRSDFPSPPGGRGGAWNDVKGLDAVEEYEMRGGGVGGGVRVSVRVSVVSG